MYVYIYLILYYVIPICNESSAMKKSSLLAVNESICVL